MGPSEKTGRFHRRFIQRSLFFPAGSRNLYSLEQTAMTNKAIKNLFIAEVENISL